MRSLSATIWLTDMASFAEMNQVWDRWVAPGAAPARATVGSAKLAAPEYQIEIAVIAAVREGVAGYLRSKAATARATRDLKTEKLALAEGDRIIITRKTKLLVMMNGLARRPRSIEIEHPARFQADYANGFSSRAPVGAKCSVFRVTTVRS